MMKSDHFSIVQRTAKHVQHVSPRPNLAGITASPSPIHKLKMLCPIPAPHPHKQNPPRFQPRPPRPNNAAPPRSPAHRILQTPLLLCRRRSRLRHGCHLPNRDLNRSRCHATEANEARFREATGRSPSRDREGAQNRRAEAG